jgi:hypothetical protein
MQMGDHIPVELYLVVVFEITALFKSKGPG